MKMSASENDKSNGETLSAILEQTALEAGCAIMQFYDGQCGVFAKPDQSPVTDADHAAERIILAALARALPGVPVVAEEEAAAGRLPEKLGARFVLVDPLDGTREFLARNRDFTVNIALIEEGVPVLGVVYAPARNLLFTAANGQAEEVETSPDHMITKRRPISVRRSADALVAVASRSHQTPETAAWLERHNMEHCVSVGSSLKFCLIARGQADIYPRFGPTMEWDTAAGDAILRAAGGMTVRPDGSTLFYGRGSGKGVAAFCNPHFIAYGPAAAQIVTPV